MKIKIFTEQLLDRGTQQHGAIERMERQINKFVEEIPDGIMSIEWLQSSGGPTDQVKTQLTAIVTYNK